MRTVTHILRYAPSQHHRHLPIQCTPLSWVGWKKFHRQRDSTAQRRCTSDTATYLTTNQHTHSTEFVPLVSPVKAVRSGQPTWRSNMFHLFSHPTLERKTITTLSPRIDSTSGRYPGHPYAAPKLLHLPHNFPGTEMPLRHGRQVPIK